MALRDAKDAEGHVLDDADDGLAVAGADDVQGDGGELKNLLVALEALRHVDVHLVAVKVRIVAGADADVQPKGVVRHDAHAMGHHAHLVQGRLAVEQDVVAVLEVPVDNVARLQDNGVQIVALQPDGPVALADVLGAGMNVGAVAD